MAMLEWNDSLSVNVAEIDAQHKGLVDMINKLYDSMRQEHSASVLLDIVDDMQNYAVVHFGTEERHMDEKAYPGASAHKAEHAAFVEKVVQVNAGCREGTTALSMDILNFLSGWLVTHINGEDKQLGAYLNSVEVY